MSIANEEWLPVAGYEGLYEVSDHGRVRSLRRSHKVLAQTSSGRHAGYLTVEMRALDGSRRQRFVHSLVIRAFRGPPPTPDHRCAHDDGLCQNNVLPNLLWKTMKGNMDDRERHGRTAKGERHGKARMSEAQARAVKALVGSDSDQNIADVVGVSRKSVEAIRANRTWRHI